ncbi:bifunctional metallophosphatase/5'-nucleotidase [Rubrivivax albus]|uniref:Bifunctional metallophosphatase/5'-nucleotidase n=1 Tax=Rubrivivax albus TaxID=2499835 RepID=A0A3S2WYW1_9BURK|nr:5'-nucleotidase C-terminal domain-containing protein [Rubrivivax albus]RVT49391.1 bifunctional metallophosphatase/5'-nucleotidase [Rubrivivax albus]
MPLNRHPIATLLSALALAALAACGGDDDGAAVDPAPSFAAIELNIAHVNDHHSQLEGFPGTTLTLDGTATRVTLGGFARLTSIFQALEDAGTPNLLKIHAGDAVTGTLYYTFFKGEADARMMNTICFDAFALGNHEFDDGDAQTAAFLDALWTPACQTPILAANVQPAIGTPLAPLSAGDYIQPYVIREFGGVKVALIGIDIAGKTTNSSRPLASTVFADEVATAQAVIDQLKAEGLRHFVLVTHQGYQNDLAMAAALTDVDAIVGGDSHSLLGDFTAYGLSSSGAYPTVAANADGKPVCIGQAWEYAKAVGLMNVRFDATGAVASCGGQASLVIGDDFARDDGSGSFVALDDTARAALKTTLAADPALKVTSPDAGAAAVLASYTGQVDAEKAKPIGTATEALCLVRVPGESTNRSAGTAGCEDANTLARGSDAAQAVAQAFLAGSRRADLALQNAGGVRIPVAAGTLTMNTAFTLLPFTNVIVELEMTGAEVIAALEDAVANHLDAGQSTGSHPYAAGLRWDLDMSQAKGARFSNVQVKNRSTGVWSAIDPAATYVVATNDFIAEGRDGYTTLGTVFASGRVVNTYLLYTQTFADWVVAEGSIARPARGEYSHQVVITASGTTLP